MDKNIVSIVKFLNNLWNDTITPTIKSIVKKNEENTSKIVSAIQGKENPEQIAINNTKDITQPILEAQNRTTSAVENIKMPDPVDFSSLEAKFEALKVAFEKKEMTVNVGKTKVNVDNKSVVNAIKNLKFPEFKQQEIIDYTLMLDEMMKILERPADNTEIKKLQSIVAKLGTHEDLVALSEWLKAIAEKKYPEPQELPMKGGRVLVSVDKVGGGGGGGGLTAIENKYLKDISENTLPVGFAANANLTITDTTDGDINTIVITDGVKTKTVTINNATDGITIVWT
jgi:hypothetical protein